MQENTKKQVEEAFSECSQHMESLMARLPFMQEKGEKLGKIREAELLLDAGRRYESLLEERSFMKAEERRFKAEGKDGMSAYIQSEMGYRQGPLNEAEENYKELLKKSGFESAEMAEKWLSDCEDASTLEQEIKQFQEEYNRVLEQCRDLDEKLSAMEEE